MVKKQNDNKKFGIRKEREYKNKCLKEGGIVSITRAAGSLGDFDLIVLKSGEKDGCGSLELVSVKSSRGKVKVKKKELEKIRQFIVPKTLEVVKKLAVWENRKWKEYV